MSEQPLVHLDRFGWIDAGVFSLLWCAGKFTLCAAEPEERAVPTGLYRMRRDFTGKHRWWTIEGERVGLAGSGAEWEQVELHVGNWPTIDSEACILPGFGMGPMPPPGRSTPLMAVTESRAALDLMARVLGEAECRLLVSEGPSLR